MNSGSPGYSGGTRGRKLCARLTCNRVDGTIEVTGFNGLIGLSQNRIAEILSSPAIQEFVAIGLIYRLGGGGTFQTDGAEVSFWDYDLAEPEAMARSAAEELTHEAVLRFGSRQGLQAAAGTGLVFIPGSSLALSVKVTLSDCKLSIPPRWIRLF